MSARILLLDFDGVVLRNRRIMSYLSEKSAEFMNRHVNHLSMTQCRKLNEENYKRYGHTVAMVNHMFSKNVSLEEYNSFVFRKKDMQLLTPLFKEQDKAHMQEFVPLLQACDSYVFTNAHPIWVWHFACLGRINQLLNPCVIWSENCVSLLKPSQSAYIHAEGFIPLHQAPVFLDDSLSNIKCAPMEWISIHYDGTCCPLDILEQIKLLTC